MAAVVPLPATEEADDLPSQLFFSVSLPVYTSNSNGVASRLFRAQLLFLWVFRSFSWSFSRFRSLFLGEGSGSMIKQRNSHRYQIPGIVERRWQTPVWRERVSKVPYYGLVLSLPRLVLVVCWVLYQHVLLVQLYFAVCWMYSKTMYVYASGTLWLRSFAPCFWRFETQNVARLFFMAIWK